MNTLWKKVGLQDEALLEEAHSSLNSGSGSESHESEGSSNERGLRKQNIQSIRDIETIIIQGDSYTSGWITEGK